jgi:hypothetical protein
MSWQDEDAKRDFARENPREREVAFHAIGTPAPKGSVRAFAVPLRNGKFTARVIPDNRPQSRSWIALVVDAARAALGTHPPFLEEALRLECVFALQRPAGHFGKRGLKPGAPTAPHRKPDVDKLARQVGDALKGLLYDDDARIVQYFALKVYAGNAQPTGVAIWLRPVDAAEVMAAELRYTSLAGGGQRQPELATGG